MNIQFTSSETVKNRPLGGRVALITGSTSGIGLGIARTLGAAGAAIVLNGLGDAAAIADTVAELRRSCDVPVSHAAVDVSDPQAVAMMCDEALELHGRLDILVNNAGIQHVAPIEEFPTERWNTILAVNLSSAFYASKAAVPAMRRAGFGRIINVASAHGLVGSPFKSAYVAAKHGLVGLTRTIALETAEDGITCNAICPGYVHTPLVEAQIDAQAAAHGISRDEVVRNVLLAQQPNRRFASIEEIGALAAFLAGEAAASITGATLAVDGGWTAH